MTRLSVNINKIATLRNARGQDNPNLVQTAKDCERFGAQGITIHPRPDQRHITRQDVFDLKQTVATELNIEGYPSKDFLELICQIKPTQATLVPDPPNVLTSNAGWNTVGEMDFLKDIVAQIKSYGVRCSIFIDPIEEHINAAKKINADCIELYTEHYATQYAQNNAQKAIIAYQKSADLAHNLGLIVNAGHDLNLQNLAFFKQNIPHLDEVSIGHALICDALYLGLENTIQLYLRALKD